MQIKSQTHKFFFTVRKNLYNSNLNLVKNNDKILTYLEAKEKVSKIIYKLKKIKKKRIAIFSGKCANYYVSVLSVLFSGNVWVQISPSMPHDRIKQICKIADIKYGIYDESFGNKKQVDKLKLNIFNLKKILKDDKKSKIRIPNVNVKDTSMIFFTSGSTGIPKGVEISYENFTSCLFHQLKNLKYRKNKEVFSDYHDVSFVMSLVVIFPAVYLNCTISPLVEMNDKMFPAEHLRNNKITVLITVPSFILYLKEHLRKKIKLNNLILCGENFPLNILKLIQSKFKLNNLFNLYGSTETSPWAFFYNFNEKDINLIKKYGQVPIGKPFNDINIRLENNNELLINGKIISKGYFKNKKINKEKFIYIKNKKFYKTGDIIKKEKDVYFCIGRTDTQVKLRGYRIDTTEVESHIKKIKEINYAFCFLNEKTKNPFLVLIIITDKKNINENLIINYLKKYVPNYMIPKKIILMKKIKFNKNGKVDKIYYRNKF
jgi:D-alanine--poly(phosphoribitol) ligase subunit 1|tara:strand:+ start:1985 stop:3448 length:1464 start_codon:yes stop_codon:yes gene_type:complete